MKKFTAVPPTMPNVVNTPELANPFSPGGNLVVNDAYALFPEVFGNVLRESDTLFRMAADSLSICAERGNHKDALAWHKQAIMSQNLKLATIQTMAKSQEVAELRKKNNADLAGKNARNVSGNVLDAIDPAARKAVVDIIARRVTAQEVVSQ